MVRLGEVLVSVYRGVATRFGKGALFELTALLNELRHGDAVPVGLRLPQRVSLSLNSSGLGTAVTVWL